MDLFKNLRRKKITAKSPETPAQRDVRGEVTGLISQLSSAADEQDDSSQREIVKQLDSLLESVDKSTLTLEDVVFVLDQLARYQLVNFEKGRLLAIHVQNLLTYYADNFIPGMDLIVSTSGRDTLLLSTNVAGNGLTMGVTDDSITATQINTNYEVGSLQANVVRLMRLGATGFHLQTPPSKEA